MNREENPYVTPADEASVPDKRRGLSLIKGCAIALGCGVLLFLVACALLIRSIRNSWPRYEALVTEDIRMVMLAEEQYAEANGGYYDRIECLVRPAECIPSYPENGPVFLEGPEWRLRGLIGGSRGLYSLRFEPGPRADAEGVSPSSVRSYAFVADPVFDGPKSFCGDSTRTFCVKQMELGVGPTTANGRCADAECLPPE